MKNRPSKIPEKPKQPASDEKSGDSESARGEKLAASKGEEPQPPDDTAKSAKGELGNPSFVAVFGRFR